MRKAEDVRVLVVDDEPDVRDFLASVLEDAGIQVETAADGAAALESIRRRVPDLISTDLVMPGKSGIRLIHELRTHPEWSGIPVLIVTGHARDNDIRGSLDDILSESSLVGPSSCLEKPITPHGYLENVCRLLDVEVPELDAAVEVDGDLRREASALLEGADRATLETILSQLRGEGGPPGGGSS
jgi:CheY-like chemotaxis protein